MLTSAHTLLSSPWSTCWRSRRGAGEEKVREDRVERVLRLQRVRLPGEDGAAASARAHSLSVIPALSQKWSEPDGCGYPGLFLLFKVCMEILEHILDKSLPAA